MYKIHTTREGDSMLVCQMTDSHLTNTVKLFCKQMIEARKLLEGGSLSSDPLLEILAPQFNAKAIRERAESAIKAIHEALPPYVVETALRGIDVGYLLQEAYGRRGQLPNLQVKVLTLDSEDDDDGDDDMMTSWESPIE